MVGDQPIEMPIRSAQRKADRLRLMPNNSYKRKLAKMCPENVGEDFINGTLKVPNQDLQGRLAWKQYIKFA